MLVIIGSHIHIHTSSSGPVVPGGQIRMGTVLAPIGAIDASSSTTPPPWGVGGRIHAPIASTTPPHNDGLSWT